VTPEVLTVTEVSQILQISRNRVYELVRSGKIRTLRIGSAIRVPRTALDEFIQQVPEPVEVPDVGKETTDAEVLAEAARDLRAANAETYIRALVDGFPPLTEAQRERLRALLQPDRQEGAR
jgi:excisionase family DNA binding protein